MPASSHCLLALGSFSVVSAFEARSVTLKTGRNMALIEKASSYMDFFPPSINLVLTLNAIWDSLKVFSVSVA